MARGPGSVMSSLAGSGAEPQPPTNFDVLCSSFRVSVACLFHCYVLTFYHYFGDRNSKLLGPSIKPMCALTVQCLLSMTDRGIVG